MIFLRVKSFFTYLHQSSQGIVWFLDNTHQDTVEVVALHKGRQRLLASDVRLSSRAEPCTRR